ncbi:MAG: hypothetical protein NC917_05630, partial [Candidatus Omnitrophica bacterium]|nr:hypothetical protein [Candidatus Omnitrophota bacterium]
IDQITIPEKDTIAIFNQCSFTRKDICFFELDIPEGKGIEIYKRAKELKHRFLIMIKGEQL